MSAGGVGYAMIFLAMEAAVSWALRSLGAGDICGSRQSHCFAAGHDVFCAVPIWQGVLAEAYVGEDYFALDRNPIVLNNDASVYGL